jgi:hypothetical protein
MQVVTLHIVMILWVGREKKFKSLIITDWQFFNKCIRSNILVNVITRSDTAVMAD